MTDIRLSKPVRKVSSFSFNDLKRALAHYVGSWLNGPRARNLAAHGRRVTAKAYLYFDNYCSLLHRSRPWIQRKKGSLRCSSRTIT